MSATHQFPPPHVLPEEGEEASPTPSNLTPDLVTRERDNREREKKKKASDDANEKHQLYLPAPSDEQSHISSGTGTTTLDVSTGARVALDQLGPMVVNKNGTLSRIHNWANMTEAERARTLRVLGARNQLRMADLRRDGEDGGEEKYVEQRQGEEAGNG